MLVRVKHTSFLWLKMFYNIGPSAVKRTNFSPSITLRQNEVNTESIIFITLVFHFIYFYNNKISSQYRFTYVRIGLTFVNSYRRRSWLCNISHCGCFSQIIAWALIEICGKIYEVKCDCFKKAT